ncbi:MAG: ATP-binding protein [Anaerolineae bacterium]|nr:ATP-binding protein [Anaerolineae bacterium]
MTSPSTPLHLRIFVSSPGDVGDERTLALQVIDQLPYDPLLRGKVTFEVVAWDKPGAGTPMLATMTPQAAIDAGLPRPSECDIVAVIFWARMGTPLPHPEYQKPDGQPYYSGTEWEYADAMRAAREYKRPDVVVYRRTEEPVLGLKDPKRKEKTEQWERVEAFFAEFRDTITGVIVYGYNEYEKPEDFRRTFESHLKVLVKRRLDETAMDGIAPKLKPPALDLWPGSPFPGLRAFTPADAPIFFGRGRETDALLQKVSTTHFVAVVGASGSGKSSLVGAGLLPRLAANALEGSKDWILPDWDKVNSQWWGLRFTPGEVGDNPFEALAIKLAPLVRVTRRELTEFLEDTPTLLETATASLFNDKPAWAEAMLFIDQFEELFTLVASPYRLPFIELLVTAVQSERLRVVVTMRSDFYAHCIEVPTLGRLFEMGIFPLAMPTDTLLDIIIRPTERAGLQFEEGLPGRILHDIGLEPYSLVLIAYLLDQLYHADKTRGQLSYALYEGMGGAGGIKSKLMESMAGGSSAHDSVVFQLVKAFSEARVLVESRRNLDHDTIIKAAYEALLQSWSPLVYWIKKT